ncbi:hypothetical protein HDU87_006272 [Geranomyces variabilis]|uniref:DNA2/NAM7 helicase helicase domain-containing protein n=1 Tax=Geranomyces variabilis TaxID=109894 RepID=A0AAD5XNI8_9FUNG|nr:hypothetical protein HDU87_006272 [Geranomyces variabilis]
MESGADEPDESAAEDDARSPYRVKIPVQVIKPTSPASEQMLRRDALCSNRMPATETVIARRSHQGKRAQCGIKHWIKLAERKYAGQKLLHNDARDYRVGCLALERMLIVDCDVVVCTPHMYHAWAAKFAESGVKFGAIIVDEASAVTVAELISLFTPHTDKVYLCGDRMQLGPSIATKEPEARPASWNILANVFDTQKFVRLSLQENHRVPRATLALIREVLPSGDLPRPSQKLEAKWKAPAQSDYTPTKPPHAPALRPQSGSRYLRRRGPAPHNQQAAAYNGLTASGFPF